MPDSQKNMSPVAIHHKFPASLDASFVGTGGREVPPPEEVGVAVPLGIEIEAGALKVGIVITEVVSLGKGIDVRVGAKVGTLGLLLVLVVQVVVLVVGTVYVVVLFKV